MISQKLFHSLLLEIKLSTRWESCLFILLLLFTMVESQINCYRNRFLWEKLPKDIALVFDFAILAQKWLKIAVFFVIVLRHSLMMDLGQNQHQHPTVNSGGVSRVLGILTQKLGNVAVMNHFPPISTIFNDLQPFLVIFNSFQPFQPCQVVVNPF